MNTSETKANEFAERVADRLKQKFRVSDDDGASVRRSDIAAIILQELSLESLIKDREKAEKYREALRSIKHHCEADICYN